MSNSGIVALSDGVRAYFAQPYLVTYFQTLGVSLPVVGTCGWKQREQILNVASGPPGQVNRRVLFMPGTEGGDEGATTQPRRTSGNPRTLLTWNRIVTASIWAVDTSDGANEEAQIAAADNLFEMTVQALQQFAAADFVVDGAVRRDPKTSKNLPFGREVLFQFIHREPLFDIPQQVVMGVTPTVERTPTS